MENKPTILMDDEPSDKCLTLLKKEAARWERLAKKSEVHYGNVPVYYGGHKVASQYKEPSIMEQILKATTVEEVETALKKGIQFKRASMKTVKKWKKAAGLAAKKLAETMSK